MTQPITTMPQMLSSGRDRGRWTGASEHFLILMCRRAFLTLSSIDTDQRIPMDMIDHDISEQQKGSLTSISISCPATQEEVTNPICSLTMNMMKEKHQLARHNDPALPSNSQLLMNQWKSSFKLKSVAGDLIWPRHILAFIPKATT